jgi:pimeloyl-ACP methyl ester carboxylesterase
MSYEWLEYARGGTSIRDRIAMVNEVAIHYVEAGPVTSPTLVLLHGFPSSSHMYRNLIPALADKFYLVAPDYPGFGQSDTLSPDQFSYSFDHLAETMEQFLQQIGANRFWLYMQGYGGPVGFRIAVRHPKWVEGLIIQNTNVYREGLLPSFTDLLGPLWRERTQATEEPVLKLFELEATKFQYQHGTHNPERIDSAAWNTDQKGLDRPGNKAIQLELQADYYSNLERYPEWQDYLRQHQPPTLVLWGQGDPFWGVANVELLRRDLVNIETYLLDTGHFALEEKAPFITERIRRFVHGWHISSSLAKLQS